MSETLRERILLIGATGRTGRHVAAYLTAAGLEVRALVRNPEAARLPPQVEVMRGDLTVPETVDPCLKGVDAVFLVWCAPAATAPAVVGRIANHARRIVFLSSPWQTAHPMFQAAQPNPAASLHAQVERLIRSSGVEWTFLRPGMFASNALWWWSPQIRAGNVVRWPCGLATSAPVDERDIAAVASRAVRDHACARADYVLTGPESLTHLDQVAAIAGALGRRLQFEEISPEDWLGLQPEAPEFVGRMLLAAWAASIGQPALITPTVEEVTRRRSRAFREWVADNAPAFE